MRGHFTTLREELEAVWQAMPGEPILARLQSHRWTGRPGHSLGALWRAYVASYYLHLPHTNALIRRLQDDEALRNACGFDELPSRWTFNRFFIRLSEHSDLVHDALDALTDVVATYVPDFGKTVAVDSTTVRTHANPFKHTDPDASWTAKSYNKGNKAKKEWYYGYKLHLAVDAVTELPIEAHVTTGSRSDMNELLPSLHHAKERFSWFNPEWVLADKGYDSAKNFTGVAEAGAVPIIDVRRMGKNGVRGREHESRPCEAYAVITPDGVRHMCDRWPWTPKCPRFEQCPLFPVFVDSDLNPPGITPVYERYAPFPYGSKEWKAIYSKRSSVERVNSRLKECRRLEGHCFRGLAKLTTHALLSVVVMQATSVAHLAAGDFETMRWSLRRVA